MNNIEEYRCKNGEIVQVTDVENDPEHICVKYHGKNYKRPRSIIGKTLFSVVSQKCKIKHGSYVEIKDVENGEILQLFLAETIPKIEYRGMGGSYYNIKADIKHIINAIPSIPETVMQITSNSPIGKALYGKRFGGSITVLTPDNAKRKYRIIYVNNDIYDIRN